MTVEEFFESEPKPETLSQKHWDLLKLELEKFSTIYKNSSITKRSEFLKSFSEDVEKSLFKDLNMENDSKITFTQDAIIRIKSFAANLWDEKSK